LKILVVDVGGTHIKILATGQREPRKAASGPAMTARRMVAEPHNLGKGWIGFDFRKAFGRPVKMINDAAMQALGSYRGGRMLFLGLGTGLGSAMIIDGVLEPMELGHLPYQRHTFEHYVGNRGLKRLGEARWRKCVLDVVERLRAALGPDEVVIGGGNAARLGRLPRRTRLGDNANAFDGGFSLWTEAHAHSRRRRSKR
jgi:polyphosphate glucokinase